MKRRPGRPKGAKGKRWCSRCKKWLPLTAFGSNIAAPSGLQPYCRSCTREYQADRWRKKGQKEAKHRRRKGPEASHRKPRGLGGVDRRRRKCLACLKWFVSEGNWNRRCPRCTTALSGVVPVPAC
ncbi:MAG TPA: hypothetical protein VMW52_07635, partial [Phycisphaerae bacterium]|nr:hypothetical protein [Phycisphaerae bacterium]